MRILRTQRGMTLIELLTVVSIIGLLAAVLAFSFRGWIAKYKVEDQAKRMYADIADARARAMQKKRMTFVQLNGGSYRSYEDTNTGPDGNGTLESAADTLVADSDKIWNGGLSYTINDSGLASPGAPLVFSRDGIALNTGMIRMESTLSPDYDCIQIYKTRIRIGRYDGAICQQK